jgi:hypothetical protein
MLCVVVRNSSGEVYDKRVRIKILKTYNEMTLIKVLKIHNGMILCWIFLWRRIVSD